jgi:hypothetical protein
MCSHERPSKVKAIIAQIKNVNGTNTVIKKPFVSCFKCMKVPMMKYTFTIEAITMNRLIAHLKVTACWV